MTESMVVHRWIERAETKAKLEVRRRFLLEWRFPGKASEEIKDFVNQQSDLSLLRNWSLVVAQASTIEEFLLTAA